MLIECPHVSIIEAARRDSLTGIDDRTATHSQNEVNVFVLTELNTLSNQGQTWVRLHATQLDIGYPCFLKCLLYLCQKTRTDGTLTTIMEQDFGASVLFDEFCYLCFCVTTEHYLSGCIKIEILHISAFN